MSSYVKREREGRSGWTGPIRSPQQAERERAAWVEAGWTAEVHPSTPDIRAQVRAWMTATRERGRTA